MKRSLLSRSLCLIATVALATVAFADERAPEDVLVEVDGHPITEADLQFEMLTVGVPEDKRESLRRVYLERLVERQLLGSFLASRKVTAKPEDVEAQVFRIKAMMKRRDQDPDAILKRIGYDDASLRRALELPIAWETYAFQVARPEAVRKYWAKHRAKFDGTTWRARQILFRIPEDATAADVSELRARLSALRTDIVDGKLDFATAAREHSQAPSAKNGGDVGRFRHRGKMPVTFTRELLDRKPGDVTEPFRSPFGLHLVQVTEREPGEYSLEDVRPAVFSALANEIRRGLIAGAREAATIEWADAD